MDKITGLMELLGEDNNKKIKDNVAKFIIDAVENDIHDYSRESYILNPEEIIDFENEISEEQMKKIIGFDPSRFPNACDIIIQKFVQARKHKKRRINKKWLKRYGYKIINVRTNGWKIHTSNNGEIVFQQ